MNQISPTLLIILDGYGIAPPGKYNAVTLARKPTIDSLMEMYPNTQLGATGADVGLEDGKMSGSEAGHMNIGAGRIAYQDSFYITESIKDNSFYMNPALSGAINHAKSMGSNVHLMGLMGDYDSPHSDPDHFRAILKMAKSHGIREIYCHLFTDGRDSFPKSAHRHLENFDKIMAEEGIGKIATLCGRFYAMDRAKNWDRLIKAYEAIVFSRGEKAESPKAAIDQAYAENLTDEYLLPTVICSGGNPIASVKKDDSLIFFNLRSDRARQFTKLFVADYRAAIDDGDIPNVERIENLYFAALTDFGPDLDVHTAWKGRTLMGTLPMALSQFRQLYIAETEKYAHITYFMNGGYADPVNGEDRIIIPSQKIESYARMPQMSAEKITRYVLGDMRQNKHDFYAINFANADMVGHTGDLKATVSACETVDKQIKLLAQEVLQRGGNIILTADHGNAEVMFDEKENQPNTFHTKNPVPLAICGDKFKGKKLAGGVLGNIAPTILEIFGADKPTAMEKDSLL